MAVKIHLGHARKVPVHLVIASQIAGERVTLPGTCKPTVLDERQARVGTAVVDVCDGSAVALRESLALGEEDAVLVDHRLPSHERSVVDSP
ncbi:MAG: hypothetical protein JHC95_10315 [Solirubrobacteraceae bacterium]|nr:hypothetical protein [Solirubrobacteraceae bacterium]